jgi:hypothetical protein
MDLYGLILKRPDHGPLHAHVLTQERLVLSALMGYATEPLKCYWYERQTRGTVD